jgi:hypothetical protein
MKTTKIRTIIGSLLILLLLSGGGCRRLISTPVLPDDVKKFAEGYVQILRDGEAEKAKNLLHPEVQKEITGDDVKNIIKYIGKEKILEIKSGLMTSKKTDLGAGYILGVDVKYEKSNQTIIMAVSDINGDMRVTSLMVINEGSLPVFLGTTGGDVTSKLYSILKAEPEELPSLMTACVVFLFVIILLIIFLTGMWKVYVKAGEPGWAVLVPIYGTYVLARIGDKPGWMGVIACLVGFIPIVGPIIGWVLILIISIGVAKTFDKGVLFGLGLCFLPFIFYPILGFGNSEATGPEPKARDYSSGGLGAPGQQFFAPAPAPAADLPPVPMPEEPETQKAPQYKPDRGSAEQIKAEKDYIRFTCSCGKRFKVPMEFAGKMGKCPQCKMRVRIPEK